MYASTRWTTRPGTGRSGCRHGREPTSSRGRPARGQGTYCGNVTPKSAWKGPFFVEPRQETVWKLRIGSITRSHEPAERANEYLFGAWRHRKARDRTRPATFQTVSGETVWKVSGTSQTPHHQSNRIMAIYTNASALAHRRS